MEELGTGNTGEKVFIAAGKTDYFVGEDRADQDEFLVVKNFLIYRYRNIFAQKAGGDLRRPGRRNNAYLP